ncbi:hypothetical protein V5O48_001504 [Marasmius crinis-equi]|uniref:Acyl-protein thioesterase 1 n=1 Tax=Marasmius crinis-equi TaxID=585013 RepID=A0ABR3FYV2_9AGAR
MRAPKRAVTMNHGQVMPAWYDIKVFSINNSQLDEEGVMEGVRGIRELIEAEITGGIPCSRIVLGGFSQGAGLALLTGLTGDSNKRLAGLTALSGLLPLRDKLKELISPHATSIPIFWGTGSADPLVTIEIVEKCVEILQTLGLTVRRGSKDVEPGISFNIYDGLQHSTDPFELLDLKTWLKKVIPAHAKL